MKTKVYEAIGRVPHHEIKDLLEAMRQGHRFGEMSFGAVGDDQRGAQAAAKVVCYRLFRDAEWRANTAQTPHGSEGFYRQVERFFEEELRRWQNAAFSA